MHQRLAEILTEKKNEVARLKKSMPAEIDGTIPPIRDFKAAISAPGQINLIAEIKKKNQLGKVFRSIEGGLGLINFFPPGHRPYGPVAGN
jgi:hypothetical protein